MKYCGVVTDRSWYASMKPLEKIEYLASVKPARFEGELTECMKLSYKLSTIQDRRIYTDEVPMASEETLRYFTHNKFLLLDQQVKRTMNKISVFMLKEAFKMKDN